METSRPDADCGPHPRGRAARRFAAARLVLLDFDGPVTRLLPDPLHLQLAGELARRAAEAHPGLADLPALDHVQLLRAVHASDPVLARRLEGLATRAEMAHAPRRAPTAAAVELVGECHRREVPVCIVTNNAPAAVRLVLAHAGALVGLPVYGRRPDGLADLKPAPTLLLNALADRGVQPGDAVFVGDTVGDVRAGHAAGVDVIGCAKSPDRVRELAEAGAYAVAADLRELLPATVAAVKTAWSSIEGGSRI